MPIEINMCDFLRTSKQANRKNSPPRTYQGLLVRRIAFSMGPRNNTEHRKVHSTTVPLSGGGGFRLRFFRHRICSLVGLSIRKPFAKSHRVRPGFFGWFFAFRLLPRLLNETNSSCYENALKLFRPCKKTVWSRA